MKILNKRTCVITEDDIDIINIFQDYLHALGELECTMNISLENLINDGNLKDFIEWCKEESNYIKDEFNIDEIKVEVI